MTYEAYMEDADYEFNARYDYVHEAFAATALDGAHEAYCDYCLECEEEGVEPKGFHEWRNRPLPAAPLPPDYGFDDIPF